MANEQRINDIIDIAAITKQVEATEQQLGRIVATIAEINKSGVTFKGTDSKGIPEATKQIDELGRATQKLANLQTDAGKAAYQNIQATKELTKAEQLQANATNELSGAWERARAKGQLLDKQARDLGFSMYELEKAGKKDTAEYQKLEAEFNKVSQEAFEFNAEIKKVDASINIHSKNVGNYESVAVSLRQEIKNLTQTLATMEMQGKNNSKEYKTMVMRLGELKDAVGDVQARSKFFADDARYINTAVQAVQGLVGAYSVYVGVTELVGEKNEELEKIMRKMMALMTVMQGLQQVANMLNKDSYVRVAAQLAVDKLKVWWTNLQTAATIKGTIAQKALNVAMKMNPIGLIIAALTALVALMGVYLHSLKKEREQQDENNKLSEQQREELYKRGKAYKKAIEDIDGYIKKLEDQGKTELELILQSIELRRQQDLLIAKAAGAISNEAVLVENLTKKQKELKDQIDAVDVSTISGLETQKKLQMQYDGISKELAPLNDKLQTHKELSTDLTKIINENADAERKRVIELSKEKDKLKTIEELRKEELDFFNNLKFKGKDLGYITDEIKKQAEAYVDLFNKIEWAKRNNLEIPIEEYDVGLMKATGKSLEDLKNEYEGLFGVIDAKGESFAEWWGGITNPEKAEFVVDLVSKMTGAVSDFSEISDNKGKQEVESFKVQQDEKLRVLNERLRLGFISEEQYMADKSDLELEFEAKKKEIEKREFERKKKLAYAEAVINGASAAISALKEKTLAMKVIALAFVALTLAAQLSKISSSSPGYAKGRKDGPGEFAKVGEQGWEYTGDENSIFKTPNSTTLTYLKPHQWVMPHHESVQLEKTLKMPGVNMPVAVKENKQNDDILNELKRLNKKPTAVVNMDKHGIRAGIIAGNSFINYVNNNLTMKR